MTDSRGVVVSSNRGNRIALDVDVAESAARLRASLRLKLADAVQAASALAINAPALVTHDRDFLRVRSRRLDDRSLNAAGSERVTWDKTLAGLVQLLGSA